jgi:hypothetical protein
LTPTSLETDSDISGKEIDSQFYFNKYVMETLLKLIFLHTKQLGGLNKKNDYLADRGMLNEMINYLTRSVTG